MLENLLKERKLPDVLTFKNGIKVKNAEDWKIRRMEILDILSHEIYGFSPAAPDSVYGEVKHREENAFAGKAVYSTLSIGFDTPKGYFSFPLSLIIPKKVKRAPVFLNIAFRPDIPDKYLPVEELIDNGYAIASFCYKDVSPDMEDGFSVGLPAMYPRDSNTGWGKISIWAWAAMRVMDYLQGLEDIDRDHVAVIGHSRLGKTALWCGAQDERFSMAISNNSGCSGAALHRGKEGEHISNMKDVFPFWFCGNFKNLPNQDELVPFDQHYLLSLIAPRALYISSAVEDSWADPKSEFLSSLAASPVYEMLGFPGLITEDKLPMIGTELKEGRIGYHLREGSHFLSRTDWQKFITYRKHHKGQY